MYFLSCVTIIMILEHFDHPTKKTLLPTKKKLREWTKGTSLVVQWLRVYAPNEEGLGSFPGQGT